MLSPKAKAIFISLIETLISENGFYSRLSEKWPWTTDQIAQGVQAVLYHKGDEGYDGYNSYLYSSLENITDTMDVTVDNEHIMFIVLCEILASEIAEI